MSPAAHYRRVAMQLRAARVLIFTRELLPYSQTFIREQALALRRWQPTLTGLARVEGGVDPAPLRCLLLGPSSAGAGAGAGGAALAALAREWLWVADPLQLRRLREGGYGVIHAHFGTSAVWLWPLARRLRLPLLVTLHGYDIAVQPQWWQSGAGGLINRRYPARLRLLSRQGVRFLAVSEGIRARAIDYGLPPERVAVHYIGVDTARFCMRGAPLAQRGRRIVFIGRLVEKKGCVYLLQAFARLHERLPDAVLVIIGDGPLLEPLRQHSRALGVQPQFLGALTHEAVRAQLDRSRVVCVPSVRADNGDTEGLPMLILEAAAMGIPVVTSARLAAGEGVLDGRTGFVCGERDPDALAQRLYAVLVNDALAGAMSAAAMAMVRERYELSQCTARLEAIYDEMVGEALNPAARAAAHSM
ncbi:MAG TPA: glycosyltransferase [Steroidobacteraceae bacterium]|jgi:glycosyltransferase involved in cell wall biosynthesis|nr:glycosyltransferase [Steroidobacteraceae bacterium]